MGINVNKWLGFGLRFVPYVGTLVNAVEGIKDAKGSDKLAKVKDAIAIGLPAVEDIADRQLLNDDKVNEALDGFIAAYVTFQNALAAAKASRAPQP
jgi:hypothetical protein